MPFSSVLEHGFTAWEKTKNVVVEAWEDGQTAAGSCYMAVELWQPTLCFLIPSPAGKQNWLANGSKVKTAYRKGGELIMRMA